jgi:sec-independent protein translocase protein TatC
MAKSRDLFDDTTMTFGEHLEVLRVHVFRALVGVVLAVSVALFFGDRIFFYLRTPIETALRDAGYTDEEIQVDLPKQSFWEYLNGLFASEAKSAEPEPPVVKQELRKDQLNVSVAKDELFRALGLPASTDLQNASPGQEQQEASAEDAAAGEGSAPANPAESEQIRLVLTAPEFAQLQRVIEESHQITTFKVEEGFMSYMKVCFFVGLLVASPWVFYQLWLFIAAGLYPHERKYVYVYLPMSVILFVAGALAGYFYAFPLMLDFLVGFNRWLGIKVQPRLSEYISMAMLMPLLFGVSFQLPMVMVFLERIGICSVETYKKNWRVAVLVISIASMVLTTSPDPWSMLLMMFPLLLLYVFGIFLCRFRIGGPASPIR